MTVFAPSNTQRGNGFASAKAAADQRHAENLARLADPTEQHVRFIRSRGYSIYRSSVSGGPDDHWRYCGRDIDAAQVAAEAERIKARMAGNPQRFAADAAVPIAPIAAAPRPESQKARKPEILISTPAIQPVETPAAQCGNPSDAAPGGEPSPGAAGNPEEATTMASTDHEVRYCKERGTEPSTVRADLKDIRARLGTAAAAAALGIGKSTLTNAEAGIAGIGSTVLTALYGDAGCELRPHLSAELPLSEKPAEPAREVDKPASYNDGTSIDVPKLAEHAPAAPPAAEAPPAASSQEIDALLSAVADVADVPSMVAGPLDMIIVHGAASMSPDTLQSLTVAGLIASAETRRARLLAEAAEIDVQLRAVHRLASPLVIEGAAA